MILSPVFRFKNRKLMKLAKAHRYQKPERKSKKKG